MEARRPSTSLQTTKNVVGCWLVPNYMQTPPTHYSLESSAQVAYMKTHPYHTAWEFCTNLELKPATTTGTGSSNEDFWNQVWIGRLVMHILNVILQCVHGSLAVLHILENHQECGWMLACS